MSTIAASIDNALDLLKGVNTESLESEVESDTEVSDSDQSDDLIYDEESIEESDDDFQIDYEKAETSEEISDYVKADDFMQALAQNQDYNTEEIVKAVTDNMNATRALVDILKGFSNRFGDIESSLDALANKPNPRRAALTKSEAQNLKKSVKKSSKDDDPALDIRSIADILEKGVESGECQAIDVVKAESSGSISELMNSLSSGGRKIVENFVSNN